MELLRFTRDAWGRETLAGLSFDLVWVALALGLLLIAAHLLFLRIHARNRARVSAQGDE